MAYCYECGSEVAQIDVFCPFCGISLKPFGVAEEENEDVSVPATGEILAPTVESVKPETTVEMASQEISNLANQTEFDKTEMEISKQEEESAPANTDEILKLPIESEESIEPETNENSVAPHESEIVEIANQKSLLQSETQVDDFSRIPTPSIIENLENFSAVSAKNQFSQTEQSGKTAFKDSDDELKALENRANYESVTEANSAEIEFKENSPSPVFETDFNQTIPDTNSSQLESTEDIENLQEVKETGEIKVSESEPSEKEAEVSLLTETLSNSLTETPSNSSVENSIEKPADQSLEPFEPTSAPSVYDSVKIMEGVNSFDKKPQSEAGNLEPIHVSTDQTPPENLSHTTPNIGGSDTDGKKAAKLKPLDEGTILNNRYEIIRKIGGGGMGAVYLASDNNLGGVLRAVKEMVQSYIEEEQQEKSVNDFKRESTILSTLDHNSIPTIYDYFFDEKESRFYLVMKYINGGDLSGRLRAAPEGKIDEKTVTEWSIQIADVLDYLHNRPNTIVYRDLKPANVMIDGNSGRIMLIDFGIARSINKEEKGVTAVGTMGYAPPELFSGNVEARSDIYSLGSTMFHLLTGADPQSNPLLIFDFQKNPRPRQINPLLSDQMERILMKAVEYNSTARFGSASELKQCLEEHLENLKAGRVTFGIKEVPQSVSLENQLVFCGFCGQKIVASDMFCAFCGSKQPLSQQGVHSEIYSSAPQTAKLMILGTNELESPIFNLEKDESFVGRRDPQSGIFPEVDLSKFDPQTKISRRHARIWRDGGNFLVEDLGSSNGTTVLPSVSDAVRLLPHQPHILANGDKIRIGDTTLHFVKG